MGPEEHPPPRFDEEGEEIPGPRPQLEAILTGSLETRLLLVHAGQPSSEANTAAVYLRHQRLDLLAAWLCSYRKP